MTWGSMKSIYLFENYKKYVLYRLRQFDRAGYGQLRRLAEFLKVHSTLVSQIVNGEKDFTAEQGASVAEFLGLNDLESEYFVHLILRERAGNAALRKIMDRKIQRLQGQGKHVSGRINTRKTLSTEEQSVFYSEWIYTAVRQLVAIPGFQSADKIAAHLGLKLATVANVLEFLIQTNLLIERNGALEVGPSSTHLETSSPWARVHHCNWRQKAIEAMSLRNDDDFFFSSPMTLAPEDFEAIREILLGAVQKAFVKVDASPSQQFYCLNIDWFHV